MTRFFDLPRLRNRSTAVCTVARKEEQEEEISRVTARSHKEADFRSTARIDRGDRRSKVHMISVLVVVAVLVPAVVPRFQGIPRPRTTVVRSHHIKRFVSEAARDSCVKRFLTLMLDPPRTIHDPRGNARNRVTPPSDRRISSVSESGVDNVADGLYSFNRSLPPLL